MRAFLLRFMIFICLVSLIIYDTNHLTALSIFIYTIALTLFYFLSYNKTFLYMFYALSLLISAYGFVIHDAIYSSLLLLLFAIIALKKLKKKTFTIYVLVNSMLSFALVFLSDYNPIKGALIIFFMAYILITYKLVEEKERYNKKLYNELIIEYRQLKRLYSLSERETRLEERTRIARDLHDSVGHRLTALIMKLEMLKIQQKNDIFEDLKEMANDSLQETRQAVQALQVTDYEGIASVVHLIRKLEAESHLLINFNLKQGVLTIPLSNENSAVLYRVIQESLTNVMRHSPYKDVHITLAKSPVHSVEFIIENKILAENDFEIGFGLKTMKKRVEEIDGQLDVYKADDKFIVRGIIPSNV